MSTWWDVLVDAMFAYALILLGRGFVRGYRESRAARKARR